MYRVGTFSLQTFIQSRITDTTARLAQAQTKIATGQEAQRYDGIAGDVPMTVNLQNTRDRLEQYKGSSETVNLRLSATHTALDSIIDIATSMRAQVIQALAPGNNTSGRVSTVAAGNLDEVVAALNTDLGGVHLFSGQEIDAEPINPDDPSFAQRVKDGTYYQGSGDRMQVQLEDDRRPLSYGLTADHPGFRDLLHGLRLVVEGGEETTPGSPTLSQGLDLLNAAIDNLIQAGRPRHEQGLGRPGAGPHRILRADGQNAAVEHHGGGCRQDDDRAGPASDHPGSVLHGRFAHVADDLDQLSEVAAPDPRAGRGRSCRVPGRGCRVAAGSAGEPEAGLAG